MNCLVNWLKRDCLCLVQILIQSDTFGQVTRIAVLIWKDDIVTTQFIYHQFIPWDGYALCIYLVTGIVTQVEIDVLTCIPTQLQIEAAISKMRQNYFQIEVVSENSQKHSCKSF